MGDYNDWLIDVGSEDKERFLHSGTAKNAARNALLTCRRKEKRRLAAALQKPTASRDTGRRYETGLNIEKVKWSCLPARPRAKRSERTRSNQIPFRGSCRSRWNL